MKLVLAVLAALFLSSCSTMDVIEAQGDDAQALLTRVTVEDLRVAREIAAVQEDRVALICYEALIPVVEKYQAPAAGENEGRLFAAFQRARGLRRALDGEGPVAAACSALYTSTTQSSPVLKIVGWLK